MDILQIISQNLLSPAILFFFLGVFAGTIKSDLKIPESISRYLSLYLMLAIGFKGGVAIANTASLNAQVLLTILAGLVVGFLLPFVGYWLLRLTTHLDQATAAALAAHYGSISMVTFVTATTFLKTNGVVYLGFIVAVLALMEAPAILSGLFLANRTQIKTKKQRAHSRELTREILANGAILLLFGTFIIGWITGQPGFEKMEGFVSTPFHGMLCLFLLDMGLLVASNLKHLRDFTVPLALFGIYMPLLGATTGLVLSKLIGLDLGTGTLFIVLCASASYIAVPAAMRLALPQAQAAIYLPMSLAVTFPFNVIVGIPLYYILASNFLK